VSVPFNDQIIIWRTPYITPSGGCWFEYTVQRNGKREAVPNKWAERKLAAGEARLRIGRLANPKGSAAERLGRWDFFNNR
jgi:hypothetical protein